MPSTPRTVRGHMSKVWPLTATPPGICRRPTAARTPCVSTPSDANSQRTATTGAAERDLAPAGRLRGARSLARSTRSTCSTPATRGCPSEHDGRVIVTKAEHPLATTASGITEDRLAPCSAVRRVRSHANRSCEQNRSRVDVATRGRCSRPDRCRDLQLSAGMGIRGGAPTGGTRTR
jgi:hypothetical protein